MDYPSKWVFNEIGCQVTLMGPICRELVEVRFWSSVLGAAMVSSRLGGSRAVAGFVIAEDSWGPQPEDDSNGIPKGIKWRAEDARVCLLSRLSWISCSNELIFIRG